MKNSFLYYFSIAVLLTGALARAEGSPPPEAQLTDELINQSVFSKDPRIITPNQTGRHTAGLVTHSFSGWGLVYNKTISVDNNIWFKATYLPNTTIMLDPFEPSPQFAHAEIQQVIRTQILMGIDHTFHLTENKYWGFIVGVGAGLNHSVYQSKYYRQVRGWPRAYDRSSPIEKTNADSFGFIAGRFGVAIRETKIWGVKGDFALVYEPTLARLPRALEFVGPDGRKVDIPNVLYPVVELSIEI